MQKETVPRNPWMNHKKSRIPYSNDWKSSRWRICRRWGCSCGWRSHSPFDSTRILSLQEQMVASFKEVGFWHPTLEKTLRFQASLAYLATITTRGRRRTTRAYLLLQAQTMAVGTEFIFHMVELARLLVVFLQFRKSRRRWAKSWVNGLTRY